MRKKEYSLLQVIIIIVISFVVSGITTGTIYMRSLSNKVVYITDASEDKMLGEFINAYNRIKNDYYENVDVSKLIKGAINGMTDTLDEQYTIYMDERQTSNLYNSLAGDYVGIGVVVSGVQVIDVLKDSPAEKSGIKSGDTILKVNDINVDNTNVIDTIQKQKDKFNITIVRETQEIEVSLTLDEVHINNVSSYIINDTNIGYISFKVFSNNISNDVEKSLNELMNKGIKALILDVRNNNGGYLNEAYDIATLFTKYGDVIYSIKTQDKTTSYKDKNQKSVDIPIYVLVNERSASASEVLASALKDNGIANIIGTKTFGKGKVQKTYSLDNGGVLKYTSSLWLRPNGDCVDGIGITPDVYVDASMEYDNQLSEAVKLLQ